MGRFRYHWSQLHICGLCGSAFLLGALVPLSSSVYIIWYFLMTLVSPFVEHVCLGMAKWPDPTLMERAFLNWEGMGLCNMNPLDLPRV